MAGNGKQVNVPPRNTSNETVPASISSSQCILELEKSQNGEHTDISENIGMIYNNEGIRIRYEQLNHNSLQLSTVKERPPETTLCVIEGWVFNERSEKLTRIMLHSKLLTISSDRWDLFFPTNDTKDHSLSKQVKIFLEVKILNEGINLEKTMCTNCSSGKRNLFPVRTTRGQEELSQEVSGNKKLSAITGIKTIPASITSFHTTLEPKKCKPDEFVDTSPNNGMIFKSEGFRIQVISIKEKHMYCNFFLKIYNDNAIEKIIPCIIEGRVQNNDFKEIEPLEPDCLLLGSNAPHRNFIHSKWHYFPSLMPSNETKILFKVKLVHQEPNAEKTICTNCSNKRKPIPVCLTMDQNKRTEESTCQVSLAKDLGKLLEEGRGDVTLSVEGGKNLKVHKLILVARSPVFAKILNEAGDRHHIPGVDFDVMKDIVRYMYTDQIDDLKTNARKLYPVACKFALDGLKKQCEDAITISLTPDNAAETLLLVDSLSKDLKSKVLEYMKTNFEAIKNSAGFLSMVSTHTHLYTELSLFIQGVKATLPAYRAA